MNTISSIKDPLVVQARALTTARSRQETQKCLLEGLEQVQWAVDAQLPVECLFVVDSLKEHLLVVQLERTGVPCYLVSEGIAKKITETNYLIPCIGVASVNKIFQPAAVQGDFVVVLDNLQDHGNIGTIIRTASAFALKDIVLTSADTDLFYKKMIDASRGKLFDMRIQRFDGPLAAVTQLKQAGYQIVATSPHARTIQSLTTLHAKPIALILGNETHGVSDEVMQEADVVVQIPMSAEVESLNVAVFAGISIYELKIRMVLTMLTHKIKATLGRNINVAGKLVQMVFDTMLKKVTDLSAQQVVLLMILKCDEFMSYEQVSKDTATFGKEREDLLEQLLAQCFVEKSEHDGYQGIRLTSKGEEFLAKIWIVIESSEQQVLAGFSEQEKVLLQEFLMRIQQNCTQVLEGVGVVVNERL